MKKHLKTLVVPILGILTIACSKDDDAPAVKSTAKDAVILNYATIVHQNYKDAYDKAVVLQEAVKTFVATPTEANFIATKTAWLTSREPYGLTEAFRFANGPIDTGENAPEGLINSWPLDESYVDYVEGNTSAGIINDKTSYPEITKAVLLDLNQKGGSEENVTVGYHAIEFLLWGQDLDAPAKNTSGKRKYTDFVTPSLAKKVIPSTEPTNQDRRRKYLAICAELLVEHLDSLVKQWAVGGSYRTTFLALEEDIALKNMFRGIANLAKAELAGERMFVAYTNQDQEDEHSCFSDNTHRDIRLNLEGIKNVYLGQYKNIEGASLHDLIEDKDPQNATLIKNALDSAVTKVEATKNPFDIAITDTAERPKVLEAVKALQSLGDNFVEGAKKLNIAVTID